MAGVNLDTTARLQAEDARRPEGEKLRRLNRTLGALRRSARALVLTTNEAAYLDEICKIIVEDCGHAMVWVGFREEDEAKSIRPAACAGFEEGYLDTLKITWADTERGRGPTGTAMRTGQVCTCRNILTDPLFLPWREEAVRRGYASSVVFPLHSGGKVFSALTIYSREPDPFSDDELKLLSDLADDFAYGLNVLRLRAAHEQAEQALRRASDQRRLALEAAELGAWDYRFDTGDVFWDERCRNMFGIATGDQIDYDAVIARIHADDRAVIEEAVKQAIAGANGGAYHQEFRVVWPDKSVHWVASHGRAHLQGGGEKQRAVRFVGVNMEITERKRAEDSLRQAQKLESVGLLAGGIAHDFNNLLVGVIGNASLAEELLPHESPVIELLRDIVKSGEQAADLTRQMLAYAGKGRFVVEPVNLSGVVRDNRALIQSSISKKIRVRFELDTHIPAVESDPSQMQQVFMNLALNAGEAIGSDAGVISCATGYTNVDAAYIRDNLDGWPIQPGPHAYLEVSDTGCGMDAPTKAKIFDPFFTTKFQGRGLGLAAVAGIVRAHKGAIELTTAPGAGARFRVLLPATLSVAAPRARSTQSNDDLRGRGTVLVVDDEQMVRDLARRSLERQGYEVLVAKSGQAAIEFVRLEGNRIQLVVLDLSMPGMSGEETVRHLRKLKPDLEVIVSSGYSEAEALRLFHGIPISGFIQKPYTVRNLARQVKAVLASPAHAPQA